MRECLGKHSCTSSKFPIGVLNGTCFFPTVQLQLHIEHPMLYGRNTDALVSSTKLNSMILTILSSNSISSKWLFSFNSGWRFHFHCRASTSVLSTSKKTTGWVRPQVTRRNGEFGGTTHSCWFLVVSHGRCTSSECSLPRPASRPSSYLMAPASCASWWPSRQCSSEPSRDPLVSVIEMIKLTEIYIMNYYLR